MMISQFLSLVGFLAFIRYAGKYLRFRRPASLDLKFSCLIGYQSSFSSLPHGPAFTKGLLLYCLLRSLNDSSTYAFLHCHIRSFADEDCFIAEVLLHSQSSNWEAFPSNHKMGIKKTPPSVGESLLSEWPGLETISGGAITR